MDRHVTTPESFVVLDSLYAMLNYKVGLEIYIEGHVCCIFDVADALDIDTGESLLSLNRAKFIYQYLEKKGIDPSRISYKGMGRKAPVVLNELSQADVDRNKRVEIRIIENK